MLKVLFEFIFHESREVTGFHKTLRKFKKVPNRSPTATPLLPLTSTPTPLPLLERITHVIIAKRANRRRFGEESANSANFEGI